MEVVGGRDEDGATVGIATKVDKLQQKWQVLYVDTVSEDVKGFNRNWGFEPNKPFYIVSRMCMKRVIQAGDGKALVLKSYTGSQTSQ